MNFLLMIVNRLFSHSAWAGIAAVATVIALIISIVQLNNDDETYFDKKEDNENRKEEMPKWVLELQYNPMLAGKGVAGLNIGDTEKIILEKLGKPDSRTRNVSNKGIVIEYIISYKYENIFLKIYTDSDNRLIKKFSLSTDKQIRTYLSDKYFSEFLSFQFENPNLSMKWEEWPFHHNEFNFKEIVPSFKGITLGKPLDILIEMLGEPSSRETSLEMSNCLMPSPKKRVKDGVTSHYVHNNAITLNYCGVSFGVCIERNPKYSDKEIKNIYQIDIKQNLTIACT